MRHKKKFNHLGRTASHRSAMLSNMAASLIMHKRIKTTVAKAKALKIFVEPLMTRSKEDTTHSRRMVFRKLQNKDAVNELFRDISTKIMDRKGGYTRILKIGNRLGDNAEMCIIELVDYNDNMISKSAAAKAAKPKRRRGGKKKEDVKAVEEKVDTITEEVVEETKAEVVVETKVEAVEEKPKAETKKVTPKEETKKDSEEK